MISPYEWQEYYLLVSVRNRITASNTFLLNHMSQEEFMEHWLNSREDERDKRIYAVDIVLLTEDVFDLLVPTYSAEHVLEG